MTDDLRAPQELGLGGTGEFPNGKVHEHDQGELRLALRAFPEKGIVAVDFGKSVNWIGLNKETALFFSDSLRVEAEKL